VGGGFELGVLFVGPEVLGIFAEGDGAVGAAQEAREIDVKGIRAKDTNVRGLRVLLSQAIRQPLVDLHQDELRGLGGQLLRERAEPGTDFHDSPSPHVRDVDDPLRHGRSDQEALTEASRRTNAEALERFASRAPRRWQPGHGAVTTGGSRPR